MTLHKCDFCGATINAEVPDKISIYVLTNGMYEYDCCPKCRSHIEWLLDNNTVEMFDAEINKTEGRKTFSIFEYISEHLHKKKEGEQSSKNSK